MKYLFIVFALLLGSSAAHAGIYIEPYLGYEMGTSEGSATVNASPMTVDDKLSGIRYGAKLGYSFVMIAVGADYMAGKLDEDDQNPGGTKDDADYTDLGIFFNFKLPVMFKIHGTYFLSSKTKGDGAETEGKGYKLGVGFTGLPFVAINLDMINVNYDDATVTGYSVTNVDVDRKTYMLSVSLPFDL